MRAVLEQADPEVALVSSKAEDGCIDVMRSHSKQFSHLNSIYALHFESVDTCGGLFQIRPHKDFLPTKGHNRVLSLHLLTDLPLGEMYDQTANGPSSDSEPRNAYDFMRRRQEGNADPNTQRWNASLRLANYAAVESAPLCVSIYAYDCRGVCN